MNSAKQSYDQYTTSQARSHEYAEMASRTESMSGQMSEDLNQQFAQYVRKHAPQDADTLLTNTSSAEIAGKRRELAWGFVQEQVQPSVDASYSAAKGNVGHGMGPFLVAVEIAMLVPITSLIRLLSNNVHRTAEFRIM